MTNKTIARFAGFAAGASMLVGFAGTTSAVTVAELQAQIAALMAQLQSMQGGASTAVQFSRDLTVGSTGADVTALQNSLIASGYLKASATGYFGALTKAAVQAWQAAMGLPATGYFGPLSRAKFGGSTTGGVTTGGSTTGGTTTGGVSGSLTGAAGSIESYTAIASLSGEEVGEGEDDVEIAGIEVEVDEGSDIRLQAVRLDFSTQPGNSDLEDFIEEVSVLLDGKVVATVDADEFNDDNDWTKTVSLDSSAIIRAGDTADLTVAVSAVGNIDTDDAGDDWALDFLTVRFVDAQGSSVTDTVTYTPVTWDVNTFATASDVELKVAVTDDESINESHTVDIDDSADTDGVEVLEFTLEAENSDITIDDVPVNFDGTGVTNLDDMITVAYLYNGSTELDSVTVETDGGTDWTATFEDLDIEISEGEKVTLTVKVDVNDIEAGTFDEGDTLTAQLSSTEVDAIIAEDEAGENIADADATGTAVGEAVAFYSSGIAVTMISATETVVADEDSADDDQVTLTIKFRVTALDGTVYVSNLATATTAADGAVTAIDVDDGGLLYRYEIDGSATTALLADTVSKTDVSGSVADDGTDEYTFQEGESADITVTITRSNASTHADSDGFHEAQMVAIGWSTTQDDDTMEVYEFSLDDFKTDPIFAN